MMGSDFDQVTKALLLPPTYQLFPRWALATVDTHEPVALAANNGIAATFPSPKLTAAYIKCARELLDLFEVELTNVESKIRSTKSTTFKDKTTPNDCLQQEESIDHASSAGLLTLLRFTTSLLPHFSPTNLSGDLFDCFIRLALGTNSRLWQLTLSQIPATNSSGALQSGLYQLITILVSPSPDWFNWLTDSQPGRRLALEACRMTSYGLTLTRRIDDLEVSILPTTASSYSLCWEAAIACWHNLPPNLTWDSLKWQDKYIPTLCDFLTNIPKPYAVQAYRNLLNLVSLLPLDFTHLASDQVDLLCRLLIDSCLAGLGDLFNQQQPQLSGLDQTVVHFASDPNVKRSLLTALLECCRYLVSRILSSSSASCVDSYASLTKSMPLLGKLVDRLIVPIWLANLRAGSDLGCADQLLPSSADKMVLLRLDDKLTPGPANAVFGQICLLLSRLGRSSSECHNSSALFIHLTNCLVDWISSDSVTSHSIGLVDSLALINFSDHLAKIAGLVTGDFSHWTVNDDASSPQQQATNDSCDIDSPCENSWPDQLINSLLSVLRAKLDSLSVGLPRCIHLVSYYALYYHSSSSSPCPSLDASDSFFCCKELALPDYDRLLSASVLGGLIKLISQKPDIRLSDWLPQPTVITSSYESVAFYIDTILGRLVDWLPDYCRHNPRMLDECYDQLQALYISCLSYLLESVDENCPLVEASDPEANHKLVYHLTDATQGLFDCIGRATKWHLPSTNLREQCHRNFVDHLDRQRSPVLTVAKLQSLLTILRHAWQVDSSYSGEQYISPSTRHHLFSHLINLTLQTLPMIDSINVDVDSSQLMLNNWLLNLDALTGSCQDLFADHLASLPSQLVVYFDALFDRVVQLPYASQALFDLACRSTQLLTTSDSSIIANSWLVRFECELYKHCANCCRQDHSSSYNVCRHLLTNNTTSSSCHRDGISLLNRLHSIGRLFRLVPSSSSSDHNRYLIYLGILLAFMSSSTSNSTFESYPSTRDVTDVTTDDTNLASLWSCLATAKSINQLYDLVATSDDNSRLIGFLFPNLQSIDPGVLSRVVRPLLNALLYDQLSSVRLTNHNRSQWPLLQQLNDKHERESLLYSPILLDNSDHQDDDSVDLVRVCDLLLPLAVSQRVLPKDEVLVQLCSHSSINNNNKITRLLTALSSLTSIRAMAPVCITAFAPTFLSTYADWLTQLFHEGDDSFRQPPTVQSFRNSLPVLVFLESLLLLWQPWQWLSSIKDDASSTNDDDPARFERLDLVRLSLRLCNLRPSLSPSQWDFLLCLITSWLSIARQLSTDDDQSSSQWKARIYRVSAALSALFVKRQQPSFQLTELICSESGENGEVGDDDIDDLESEDEDRRNSVVENSSDTQSTTMTPFSSGQEDWYSQVDALSDVLEDETSLDESEDTSSDFESAVEQYAKARQGRTPRDVQSAWINVFAQPFNSLLLNQLLDYHSSGLTCCWYPSLAAASATIPVDQLELVLRTSPELHAKALLFIEEDSESRSSTMPFHSQSTGGDLTPPYRTSLALACSLLAGSHQQSGQLLGHILLTRLVTARVMRDNQSSSVAVANFLVGHRLPHFWLNCMVGHFPSELESLLTNESVLDCWGRGRTQIDQRRKSPVMQFFTGRGWQLNETIHRALLGYLLTWDAFWTLFAQCDPQRRAELHSRLMSRRTYRPLLDRLVLILGILLPSSASFITLATKPSRLEPDQRLGLDRSSLRLDAQSMLTSRLSSRRQPIRLNRNQQQSWRDPFQPDDPLLTLGDECRSGKDLIHLAVRLLARMLQEAPSLLRNWLTTLGSSVNAEGSSSGDDDIYPTLSSPLAKYRPGRLHQLAGEIEKVITSNLSPQLAKNEVVFVEYLARLRSASESTNSGLLPSWIPLFGGNSSEAGSVKVKSRPAVREIIATYQVTDEVSLDMRIQLPANYPLSPITVEAGKGVGLSQQQWQAWITQLSLFINNQNGSILGGIDQWLRNVRQKFRGVEECPICYSVVHHSNFSLPKMTCFTCNKAFHYACMQRWFSTNRNPNCPYCRSVFFNQSGRQVPLHPNDANPVRRRD